MKKWSGRMKRWFASVSEVPEDILLDLPRITMIGHAHLSVENHRSVLAFSGEELRLAIDGGELQISGEKFVLEHIRDREIVLKGQIRQVRFIETQA